MACVGSSHRGAWQPAGDQATHSKHARADIALYSMGLLSVVCVSDVTMLYIFGWRLSKQCTRLQAVQELCQRGRKELAPAARLAAALTSFRRRLRSIRRCSSPGAAPFPTRSSSANWWGSGRCGSSCAPTTAALVAASSMAAPARHAAHDRKLTAQLTGT